MADQEDVALSAFDSFCRNAEEGRFPHLDDRDNLWRLLVVITARKASKLVRAEGRLERGGAAGGIADFETEPENYRCSSTNNEGELNRQTCPRIPG
jgi:hypothetical protein